MKTMKYKIAVLFLAVSLFVFPALSCGGGKDGGGGEDLHDNGTAEGQPGEEGTKAEEKIVPDLPEVGYGGYVFRVMARPDWAPHWVTRDIFAESQNGEPVNDAVYVRNMNLFEKYGFELAHIEAKDIRSEVNKSVKAGTDSFDAVLTDIQCSSSFAMNGFLSPFSELKYIDLGKPWWDSSANADMSINKTNFYAMGDINLMDNDATWVFFFNKKTIQDLDIGDLYEIVKGGGWTLDKLAETGRAATKDLDGDGTMDYTDQWGLTGAIECSSAFMTSAGERTAYKDSADLPILTMNTTRAADVFAKVFQTMTDESFVILAERHWKQFPSDPWTGVNINMFKDGRALFMCHPLTTIAQMRDMEGDFGILPMPKYETAQPQYCNVLQYNNASVYSVPVTNADFERSGVVLEAMAAESMYILTPAYYDITLQRKYTRDDESSGMLDLIFSTRILDVGFVFNWQNLQGFYAGMVDKKQNTFASSYEKIEPKLILDIEKTLAAFGIDIY